METAAVSSRLPCGYDFAHHKSASESSFGSEEQYSASSVLDLHVVAAGSRHEGDGSTVGKSNGKQRMVTPPVNLIDTPLDDSVESDREMAIALHNEIAADEDQIDADRNLAEAIAATDPPASARKTSRGDGFIIAAGGGGSSGPTISPAVRATRLIELAEQLAAGCVCTAADLRHVLTSGSTAEFASAARPRAVRKCVAFVNELLQSAAQAGLPVVDEPGGDTALCGWPVKSYNEWGAVQDRILVLSYHAIWRIDYSEAWSKVDHWSRTPLSEVGGLQRKGDAALVVGLYRRDGRANPLNPIAALIRRQAVPKVMPWMPPSVSGPSSSRSAPPAAFSRVYVAVPPADMHGEPVREHMLAAVHAAWSLAADRAGGSSSSQWVRPRGAESARDPFQRAETQLS